MTDADKDKAKDSKIDPERAARRKEAEHLNAASPAVVDLAQELGIDLASIKTPTGEEGRIIAEDVCRASGMPDDHEAYLTYVDAARAANLGLKAGDFTGTGPHGLITSSDIRKVTTARAQARTVSAILNSIAPSGARVVEQESTFTGRMVKIDPWARNPLLDDARQAEPLYYKAALGERPAPTLFKSGGDLPAFLASGADPQILLRVPWIARHAAAKADGQKLYRMVEDLSGPNGVEMAWADGAIDEAANREYRQRVADWLYGAGLDQNNLSPARQAAKDAEYDSWFPAEAQKRRDAQATAAEKEAKARYDAERKRIHNEIRTIGPHNGPLA